MKKNRIKKVLTGAIGTIVAATITGGTCTGTVFAAESAAGTENSVATESSQDMPGGTPPDAADAGTSGGPGGQAPGGGSGGRGGRRGGAGGRARRPPDGARSHSQKAPRRIAAARRRGAGGGS